MEIIRFKGTNKKSSIKKAVSFFYDNKLDNGKVELFLSKCRIQKDGITVHYYPKLKINMVKFKELERAIREKRKERNEA